MKKNIIFLSSILFFIISITLTTTFPQSQWEKVGDSVIIDTDKVYISATPHTITGTGDVYFNITSKVYTGNVDIVWGFDINEVKPVRAELYKVEWHNQTNSFTCGGANQFFNYSLTPKHFYCYNNITRYSNVGENLTIGSRLELIADYDFEWGDLDNKIAYWNESYKTEWEDYTSSFTSVDYEYGGMNKWFYVKNVPIVKDKSYLIKARVRVPFKVGNFNGKYWFAIKPSGETLSEAISSGHLYYLDPWWKSSYAYCQNIDIETLDTKIRVNETIDVNFTYAGNFTYFWMLFSGTNATNYSIYYNNVSDMKISNQSCEVDSSEVLYEVIDTNTIPLYNTTLFEWYDFGYSASDGDPLTQNNWNVYEGSTTYQFYTNKAAKRGGLSLRLHIFGANYYQAIARNITRGLDNTTLSWYFYDPGGATGQEVWGYIENCSNNVKALIGIEDDIDEDYFVYHAASTVSTSIPRWAGESWHVGKYVTNDTGTAFYIDNVRVTDWNDIDSVEKIRFYSYFQSTQFDSIITAKGHNINQYMNLSTYSLSTQYISSAPSVNIVHPQATTYSYNESLPLNYSAYDIDGIVALDTCKYKVVNSSGFLTVDNETIASCANTTFDVPRSDTYILTMYVNDTFNRLNWSETVEFSVSIEGPVIILDFPTNETWLNYNNVFFNFTATDSDGVDTCELWGNWTGEWHKNYTWVQLNSGVRNFTNLSLPDEYFFWNVLCNDSVPLEEWSEHNYTLGIDTIYPTIVTDVTTTENSQTITFDLVTVDKHLSDCFYSVYDSEGDVDGLYRNLTVDCNSDTNAVTVSDWGTYSLIVYVNDSADNKNMSTDVFTTVESEVSPGAPSGRSGAKVVIIGENVTWTMSTDVGGNNYDFIMGIGGKRVKEIILTNLEEKTITIDMSCEDIVGDLCKYVAFTISTLELPPTQYIEKHTAFTLDLPENISSGIYDFNIVGTAKIDKSIGKISVRARVGTVRIFSWLYSKIVGKTILNLSFISDKLSQVEIYNLIILILPFLILAPLLYFLILKRIEIRFPLTLLISFVVSIILMFIVR